MQEDCHQLGAREMEYMIDFPSIQSERLVLGQLLDTDIPKIVEYAGSEKVAGMTLNIPHPYEEKDAVFWIDTANKGFKNLSQFTFAIRVKPTGDFIGAIGLRVDQRHNMAELGYWIAVPFWNRGFATVAVSTILKFGFDQLHLNKIYATHLTENPASGKVMIKNGMVKEGELKEHTRKDGVYKSLLQYRLTKSEYDGISS